MAGMAVTWHFKPGLTWGDGAPLGAADLAFTARVGRDPNSGFANTQTWAQGQPGRRGRPADRGGASDGTELPVQPVLAELLPAHLEEAGVRCRAKAPAPICSTACTTATPLNPGLYNGPYRITAYRARAPRSCWTATAINGPATRRISDRIVIKTIGNTAALQANLLSGDVDMVPGDGRRHDAGPGAWCLQKQYPARFTYAYKPNLAYTHIDLQLDNPILADSSGAPGAAAGDRPAEHGGQADGRPRPRRQQLRQPAGAGIHRRRPDLPLRPGARPRAAGGGGVDAGEPTGSAATPPGQRCRAWTFSTSTGVRARELQQQVMQSQWRKIGVETIIKNEPPRTLFGETLKHRSFTGMAMFGWSSARSKVRRGRPCPAGKSRPRRITGAAPITPTSATRRWTPISTRWSASWTRRSACRSGPRCSASTPKNCQYCRCSSGRRRMSGRVG